MSNVNNGVGKKSETGAQKGSATSLCQELRCSSETSRDCGYSSESTSINHDNTTCSSLEGSEIACAEDCCRLCPDYITSDPEPRIVQGPYRSLLEQLEVSSGFSTSTVCVKFYIFRLAIILNFHFLGRSK